MKTLLVACRRTWIDFTVAGHSVGIDNVLETSCERVEGKQGRWRGGGRQAVVERVDPTATLPLEDGGEDKNEESEKRAK